MFQDDVETNDARLLTEMANAFLKKERTTRENQRNFPDMFANLYEETDLEPAPTSSLVQNYRPKRLGVG